MTDLLKCVTQENKEQVMAQRIIDHYEDYKGN